jgi:hypothetical protein
MKHQKVIITTIVFFLLINTTYFWEGKLGLFAMPAFLILVLGFIVLSVVCIRQIFLAIKDKLTDKYRLLTIGLLMIVLCSTFFFPNGLVNFDKLSGANLLVAQSEGAANCMTTFKLKENNRFTERIVCFGVTEIKGDYKVVNDTIYFENVEPGRDKDGFYKFALILPSEFTKDHKHFDLVRYKDLTDTIGHKLSIIKNNLHTPADNGRTTKIGFTIPSGPSWLKNLPALPSSN